MTTGRRPRAAPAVSLPEGQFNAHQVEALKADEASLQTAERS